MTAENTAIWDALAKTDPKHTKGFKRGGGFSGTAVKPMWCIRRMTEQFGPCGTGWGMSEPQFQVVPGHNSEVLVYCTVSIWYGDGKTVYGVGGDKVVGYIKANPQYNRPERWENDDEAFKKSFTDALLNAMKHIGVAADIHMGLFDDNKYVNAMREEFADEAPAPARQRAQKPADDVDKRLIAGGNTAEEFGRSVAALIEGAPDDDVIVRIARANHNGIEKLAKDAPELHRNIMAAISRAETNLKGQAA